MDGHRLGDVLLVSTSDLQGCISVFLLCSNIKNLNIFELHGSWQCWLVTSKYWLKKLRTFYSTWRMVVGILAPHSSQNVDIPFFLAMTPTRCDWGVHVDCWSEVEAACRTVELLWRHAESIGRVLLVATAEVMLGSSFVREFIAMRGPMLLFSGQIKNLGGLPKIWFTWLPTLQTDNWPVRCEEDIYNSIREVIVTNVNI